MVRTSRPWRIGRSGAAVVEYAFIAPAFIALLVGAVDVARMAWTASTIAFAAREGTRYAIVRPIGSVEPATTEGVTQRVKSRAYGLSGDDIAVAVSWTPANVSGAAVRVDVSTQYDSLLVGFFAIGPFQLTSASTMTIF